MCRRLAISLGAASLLLVAGCGDGGSAPDVDGAVSDLDGGTSRGDGGAIDGGRSPFDAGPPMACDTPGTVESAPCGRCGTAERFCTAGRVWAYGACEGERGCEPGAVDSIECGNCGSRMARCTAACEWEPTGECSGEGECAPGTRTRSGAGCPAGETREVLCGPSCGFEPAGMCEDDGCPTPGVVESAPCGMCGTQDRFCTAARVWEYGACSGEGECMPGTSATGACGMCGTERRRCAATCRWEPAGVCEDEGACAPGETRRTSAGCPMGQTRGLRCDDSCTFVESEPCVATPVACMPACASGETCVSGTCRCGSGAACTGGRVCTGGTCTMPPTCPEAAMWGCRLAPTQCGCSGGQTCDVDRAARTRICRPPGAATEGQACSDTTTCASGLACFGGLCHRWCETDAHCSGVGSRCVFERRDLDGNPLPFPARLCSIACDPITSAGCSMVDSCQILTATTMGTMAATDCRTVSSFPFPFPSCFDDTFCPRGEACVDSACQRYCRVGVASDCRSPARCVPLMGDPVIGGVAYGSCQ